MYFMSPDEIRYIESKGRLLRVHGSVNVTSYLTLERVATALPSTFIHCHKSYLVNSDYVRAFTGDRLILLSGESIPVSQRRASLTRAALVQYAKQM